MFDRVMLPPAPPPTASVTPPLEPETSLGDRLRGMGGIFANAVAPGDAGYEDLVTTAVPTGGSLASGVKGIFAKAAQESEIQAQELAAETGMALNDARVVVSQERQRELAQQPAAQESIQRPVPTPRPVPMPPAAPVGIDALLDGGRGEPANIPMPPPPPPPPDVRIDTEFLFGGREPLGITPQPLPTPAPSPPAIERPPIMPPQPPIMRPPLPPPPPPLPPVIERPPALPPRAEVIRPPLPPPPPPPPVVATPALRKPLPLPPVTTPEKTRAAATPKPFVVPDLSALLPAKPRTQKVTKPKRGRKKVVEPDQRSSRKKRKRRQRGPR